MSKQSPAKGTGHGGPARGYSWAPFQPGHTLSVRHGAHSSRITDPVARELVAGLLEDRPDLAMFPEAVWAWGRAEARCLLLADWLGEHGLIGEDGKERPGLKHVAAFERIAASARERLGLDPRSYLELVREHADAAQATVDLERLREIGRAALAEGEPDG